MIFNNICLKDLSIYGGHHSAGVIGLVESTGGGIKNIIFNNFYIGKDTDGTKVFISKKTYNDGSSAGLLGWCYGSSSTITLNGIGLQSDGWNVDGIEVNTYTDTSVSSSSSTSAGLIGACDGYSVTIAGVRAKSMDIKGTKMRECGGLADGGGDFKIEDCLIKDLQVEASDGSGSVGGLLGKATNVSIKNCYLNGTKDKPIKILSTSNNAAGLFGTMNGGKISNVIISNVFVATKNSSKYVGLLTSNTNSASCYGYNILSEDCKVGYNANATLSNFGDLKYDNNKVGLWLGNSSGTSKLVAVAIKGDSIPRKDVGTGEASVIYADYTANQNYNPVDSEGKPKSALPWLDVNPKIEIGNFVLTGNAVGYVEENNIELSNSIAYSILNEAKNNVEGRLYFNLPSGNTTDIANYLPDDQGKYSNNVYLTTYQKEESGNTNVPSNIDFPILVVEGLADADREIWSYISALTNVSSGEQSKEQATKVDAITYEWLENSFKPVDNSKATSLTVDATDGKTISVTKNAYDNQQSQFTLLKVKYSDPTGSNNNGFDIYIPVLVKKLLYTTFKVKILSGTDYLNYSYVDSESNYATADFNESITAYIEYNYDRTKTDWEKMITNGENLLWNYNKVLDLAVNTTSTLPENTKLALIDCQTKQVYYYQFSGSESIHAFDLSMMETIDSKHFKPVPVCELLDLTIDKDLEDGKTEYIRLVEDNKSEATLVIDGFYYRPATVDEISNVDVKKFTISIGEKFDVASGYSYLTNGEGYYLTIQIPNGVDVINHPLSFSSGTMISENAPVASIVSDRERSAKNYIIYDGIQQSELNVSTLKNGVPSDTIMSDGDNIQVELITNLSLTDKGQEYFENNGPAELNHQFNLYMKKYDENNRSIDVLIGAEGASYTYSITKSGETEPWKTVTKTETNSESMDKLTIECGSDIAKDIVQYFKSNKDGSLTFKTVITLPYPNLGTYFPGRNAGDANSGVSVFADSRVATVSSQLPITQNKKTDENSNRYYTQNPSEAILIYNTYDGDAIGDYTRKLGVNPSDTTNDINRTIYTSAVYNYANIEQSILSQAIKIKYTMQLFQKDNNGSYGEPLTRIDEYLPTVVTSGNNPFNIAGANGTKNLEIESLSSDTKSDLLNIQITPLTGEEFESKNFTYSNYKVVLTAVLLDKNGNELAGTKASDYIVYTNARIYQRIVDTTTAN